MKFKCKRCGDETTYCDADPLCYHQTEDGLCCICGLEQDDEDFLNSL